MLVKRLAVFASTLSVLAAQAATTAPIPTRDVDRDSAQPVTASCSGFSGAYQGLTKCQLYTVPAGKRLVVETFSYSATTDLSNTMQSIWFGTDTPQYANIPWGNNVYSVAPTPGGATSYANVYSNVVNVRIYLDAGQILAAQFNYTGGSNYQQSASFSGFLVDK